MGKRIITEARKAYLRWRISIKRRQLKIKAIEYKGGSCKNCGYNKCESSLHFHHTDPSQKDFLVSRPKSKNFEKIKLELDKCDLLCSNCHAEEHEKLQSASRVADNSAKYKVFLVRRNNKIKAVKYKGGKCELCSYEKEVAALCFHHVDPSTKSFGITGEYLTKDWEVIKSELDKCKLLCHNCHFEIHHMEHDEQNKKSEKRIRSLVPEKIKTTSIHKKCEACKKDIVVFKSRDTKRNFCSRPCRDLILNNEGWVSGEELLELRKTMSVKDIAKKINKNIRSVYERLQALNKNTKLT